MPDCNSGFSFASQSNARVVRIISLIISLFNTIVTIVTRRKRKEKRNTGCDLSNQDNSIEQQSNQSERWENWSTTSLTPRAHDLPSNFPLLTSNELFDFLDEFLDIWLWLGLLSVLFFSITSWQLYDVCCIVNIGWTLPWSPRWNIEKILPSERSNGLLWMMELPDLSRPVSRFTGREKHLMDARGGSSCF